MSRIPPTRSLGFGQPFTALLVGAVVTAAALPMSLLGAMAPRLESTFGISEVAIGVAVTAAFACAAAVGALSGLVADRDIGRALMVAACVVLALGMLTAGSLVRSWGQLLVTVAICGCANGAIIPIGYRWVWDRVSRHRIGMAFGVMQAGFPAATMLAGVAAPDLSTRWGWHAPFAAGGLLMFCLLIVFLAAERARGRDPASVHVSHLVAATPSLENSPASRSPRLLGRFVATSVLANSATSALGAYFVVTAVHSGDRPSFAAFLYGVGGCSCIVVRVALGITADRAPGRVLPTLRVLLCAGAVGMVLLSMQISSLLGAAAILGLGIGWGWSGLLSLTVSRAFGTIPGKAVGLVMTAGGSAGAALGPALFGLTADRMGYTLAWTLAASVLIVSAMMLRGVRRDDRLTGSAKR